MDGSQRHILLVVFQEISFGDGLQIDMEDAGQFA